MASNAYSHTLGLGYISPSGQTSAVTWITPRKSPRADVLARPPSHTDYTATSGSMPTGNNRHSTPDSVFGPPIVTVANDGDRNQIDASHPVTVKTRDDGQRPVGWYRQGTGRTMTTNPRRELQVHWRHSFCADNGRWPMLEALSDHRAPTAVTLVDDVEMIVGSVNSGRRILDLLATSLS